MIINPGSMVKIIDDKTGEMLIVAFTQKENLEFVRKGKLSEEKIKKIFAEHRAKK